MKKLAIILALSITTPAFAQQTYMDADYYARNRETNALRDSARAQERQADSLRRMEQTDHERNLREDRAQRTRDQERRSRH